MSNGYYVYRFINDDGVIIYVGKTINLDNRFKQHEHLTKDVKTIEYIECTSESDMAWKEIYYINLFKNDKTTNTASVYHDNPTKIDFGDKWIKYNFPEKKEQILKPLKKIHIDDVEDPDSRYIIYLENSMGSSDFIISDYDRRTGEYKVDVYLSKAQLFYGNEAYFITKKLNEAYHYDEDIDNIDYDYDDIIFVSTSFWNYRKTHKVQNYILEKQNKMTDIMRKHNEEYENLWNKNHKEIFKKSPTHLLTNASKCDI